MLSFEGDGDDLADEAEDVFGIVGAVGVVDDTGAGVGGDAVLIDDPFEGGAVAEAIVVGGGGDAVEEKEVVVAEFGFVFGELHAVDAEADFGLGVFDLFEGVLGLLLVVDVEGHELLTSGGEGVEVGWEGDAGEFALEVGGVAGAVLGVVEDGVGGMEDVPLGDLVVGVVGAELGERPVGDVLTTVGSVFVVGIKRKNLRGAPPNVDTREYVARLDRKMAPANDQ